MPTTELRKQLDVVLFRSVQFIVCKTGLRIETTVRKIHHLRTKKINFWGGPQPLPDP